MRRRKGGGRGLRGASRVDGGRRGLVEDGGEGGGGLGGGFERVENGEGRGEELREYGHGVDYFVSDSSKAFGIECIEITRRLSWRVFDSV